MQSSVANLQEAEQAGTEVIEKMRVITAQPLDNFFPDASPAFERAVRLNMGLIFLMELVTGIEPAVQAQTDPFDMLVHTAHELVEQQIRYDHLAAVLAELHVKIVGSTGELQYTADGALDFEFWAFMRDQQGKTLDPSEIANEILAVAGRSEAAAA
jgi:hypothetical protein